MNTLYCPHMTEHTPPQYLRLVPPPPGQPSAPDYSQATAGQLRRAEAINATRLITADIGHFLLKGTVFAHQLYDYLMSQRESVDWDPEVEGLRPELDEKQQAATEHLRAIWREMSLRRSRRHRPL